MQIQLLKHVLVGDADVIPTARGTVVEVSDAQGKDFIALGLASEVKSASAPQNKMVPDAENKAAAKQPKAK